MTRPEINALVISLVMMFVSVASANMLIQSYSRIMEDLQIDNTLIFIPDSLFTLVSAIFSVIWGYYTDRLDRSKVLMGGAFLSTIGFIYSAFCIDYMGLLISRVITGMGVGCVIPVGFSIIGDVVPPEERNGWFGFIAIFSSISNAAGNGLSAFLTPFNILGISWHFPFLILSIIASITIIILIFVRLPSMGSTEEGLAQLNKISELEYGYRINAKELQKMLKKPSNKYLIVSGFFSIIPGTLLIFALTTTLSNTTNGMFVLIPAGVRDLTATLMAGLVGVGYLVGNAVLSGIGDRLYVKDRRNRAKLAFIVQAIAVPFLVLMVLQLTPLDMNFVNSMEYPIVIPKDQYFSWTLKTIVAIFRTYPVYIFFFIFSFIGSFCGAGPVAAKNAVMVDVNLPEHRGTATSFFQLTEQLGKSLTLALATPLLVLLNNSYVNMLGVGVLFYIPSAILWFFVYRQIQHDLDEKAVILRERTQVTFIDYFFELEIRIDDSIQKIHDAKHMLMKDPKKAQKMINEAIDQFKFIILKARQKNVVDIEIRAHDLLNHALIFQGNLLMLSKKPSDAQLRELYEQIDQLWENSDYGNIEILYESGFLKVCEARLQRQYNPFECTKILQTAVEIYDRTIRLCEDRVVEEGSKKLSETEEKFQKRIVELLVLAKKSYSNTILLKEKLHSVITTMLEKDISQQELGTIIDLTAEYGLKIPEIVNESFDGKIVRDIKRLTQEIDALFQDYDQWQTE